MPPATRNASPALLAALALAPFALAACRRDPGPLEVRLPAGRAASLTVTPERLAGAHHWYLVLRQPTGDAFRIPAAGTIAGADSFVMPLAGNLPDTVILRAYHCTRGDARECVPVPPLPDGADGTWRMLLTPAPGGGAAHGVVSLRLSPGAPRAAGPDSARGPRAGAAPVRIVEPAGTTLSFTSAPGENVIRLRAELAGPAAGGTVHWEVTPDPAGGARGLAITQPAPGLEAELHVPKVAADRWPVGSHPASMAERKRQLDSTAMRFRITATARKGDAVYRSEGVTIRQSDIAAIREEYLALGLPHGPPPAAWFMAQTGSQGDYPYAALNERFAARFRQLKENWLAAYPATQWQVNGLYRNPGHNRYHVSRGVSSGAVPASWHQYGCAADLQTFPTPRNTEARIAEAMRFWEALHDEALLLGFQVEALSSSTGPSSGLGHVHIELDCPP